MSRTAVVIITGSIAAYKSLEVIRLLRRVGMRVLPVLTRAAERFVTPLSVAALAGEEPLTADTDGADMPHIAWARLADLVLVAPASADFLAVYASGHADSPASALLLATDAPVCLAPAMNAHMWRHPSVQSNVRRLRRHGVHVLDPEAGALACGEVGAGRLPEPETLVRAALALLPPPRDALRAVVTSGPTREPIDPVRYVSNHSSGKQGAAVAEALHEAGFCVTFITGPAVAPPPLGVSVICVQTAAQMHDAVQQCGLVDVFVGAAAPADYAPQQASAHKIKKDDWVSPSWQRTPDILSAARARFKVGFAAETDADALIASAEHKLHTKACDLIVANDVSRGIFGADAGETVFVFKHGAQPQPHRSKLETGRHIAALALAALRPVDALPVRLLPHAVGLPHYASDQAAGCDLHAAEPCTLLPSTRAAVATGLCLQLPPGTEAQVRPRSGSALKQGLTVLNAPGTIDADYRGEVKVLLYNAGDAPVSIARGDRIAQLVFARVLRLQPILTEELTESARGAGGFGSTGK